MRLVLAFLLLVLAIWDQWSNYPWVGLIPAFAAGVMTASHFYNKVRA